VLIIHTAVQPSHDWAARDPHTDFSVNANGILNLLQAARLHCPDAAFIFTSTNKVYGDTPNRLPLVELETRWEIDPSHKYTVGIDEQMSIDQTLHSVFGASKVAADILVQEYGRYFGMKTACFRGGCLTGPNHSGTALHGFLAYLMRCTATGRPYTVFGYHGKQVRDNIHSADLVDCFHQYFLNLADHYLAHVRSILQKRGEWDSSIILVMGDHSWRTRAIWAASATWTPEENAASDGGKFDDRPAYILKLAHQRQAFRIDDSYPILRTRALLDAIMNHTIRSPQDLVHWVGTRR
jgi:hypothetical protein